MIGVAVLAPSPMARARLEALVAARPGLSLVAPPRPAADALLPAAGGGLHADVLLVDPGPRRLHAVLGELGPAAPLPPVLLLAGGAAPANVAQLLRAGVRAVLPRDASAAEIAAGIAAVAAGLVALHPSAVPVVAGSGGGARRGPGRAGPEPLTPRELEVLAMMAEGMGNRPIAERLGISRHTVKFHIAAILDKLGARSRTEAVTTGMRRGLLLV